MEEIEIYPDTLDDVMSAVLVKHAVNVDKKQYTQIDVPSHVDTLNRAYTGGKVRCGEMHLWYRFIGIKLHVRTPDSSTLHVCVRGATDEELIGKEMVYGDQYNKIMTLGVLKYDLEAMRTLCDRMSSRQYQIEVTPYRILCHIGDMPHTYDNAVVTEELIRALLDTIYGTLNEYMHYVSRTEHITSVGTPYTIRAQPGTIDDDGDGGLQRYIDFNTDAIARNVADYTYADAPPVFCEDDSGAV